MFKFYFNLSDSIPNTTDWIQAICFIISTVIAWKALKSWRNQRNYSLKVEALSHVDDIKSYILNILKPDYYDYYLDGQELESYNSLKLQGLDFANSFLEMLIINNKRRKNLIVRQNLNLYRQRLDIELKNKDLLADFYRFSSLIDSEQLIFASHYCFTKGNKIKGVEEKQVYDFKYLEYQIYGSGNQNILNELEKQYNDIINYKESLKNSWLSRF